MCSIFITFMLNCVIVTEIRKIDGQLNTDAGQRYLSIMAYAY